MPIHVRHRISELTDQLRKDAGVGGAICPNHLGGTQLFQPYVGSKHTVPA